MVWVLYVYPPRFLGISLVWHFCRWLLPVGRRFLAVGRGFLPVGRRFSPFGLLIDFWTGRRCVAVCRSGVFLPLAVCFSCLDMLLLVGLWTFRFYVVL